MSAIMRRRRSLIGLSRIEGSCPEVGVLELPILRTERPRSHPLSISWLARSPPLAPLPRERVRSMPYTCRSRYPAGLAQLGDGGGYSCGMEISRRELDLHRLELPFAATRAAEPLAVQRRFARQQETCRRPLPLERVPDSVRLIGVTRNPPRQVLRTYARYRRSADRVGEQHRALPGAAWQNFSFREAFRWLKLPRPNADRDQSVSGRVRPWALMIRPSGTARFSAQALEGLLPARRYG